MRLIVGLVFCCLTACGYRLNQQSLLPVRIQSQDPHLLSALQQIVVSSNTAKQDIVIDGLEFSRHELFGATSEVLLSVRAQVRYPNGTTQNFVATERYPYQKTNAKDHEFGAARSRLYEVLAQKIAHSYAVSQMVKP